ncbi:hypothetical protein LUZ63_020676 [Rhynchospora breviuscula]|uniref:Amine oxidase domain-containing protein n=1 Tax=Rhynchospora breviuscula TaxID=2022672 RepID=A0A9Q0C0Q0_9POAL|nr:hypothetical protein LUZ63_020676 [Rhynchospora breviuscula]
MVDSPAAGSSSRPSTPWHRTRSAPPAGTVSSRPARSPCTPTTRSATSASAARRVSAARASGLGSTTVTSWPSPASRTAKPPVPPPTSRTLAGPGSPLRAARTCWTASQTTAVRAAARRSDARSMSATLGRTPAPAAGASRHRTLRDRCVPDHAERVLDDREEPVRVAQQVVGLPLGDRVARPRLGRRPLRGPGGEQGGPLRQLRGDPREQHPGVALAPSAGRGLGTRPGREHRGGGLEGADVGRGVAPARVVGGRRLLQRARGALEVAQGRAGRAHDALPRTPVATRRASTERSCHQRPRQPSRRSARQSAGRAGGRPPRPDRRGARAGSSYARTSASCCSGHTDPSSVPRPSNTRSNTAQGTPHRRQDSTPRYRRARARRAAAPMRVVVVGGGLGGLASAARLAKLGHDVTLLEAAARTGGALAPLERDGFRWDSGASATALPAVLRDLFRKTGRPMERELELVALDPARQHRFEEGGQVDLPAGSRATQVAALDALEPGLGRRWADWTAGFADTWEALRRDWLEQPWTPWSAEHASPLTRAAFASRRTVHRAVRALKDDRLADMVRSEWVLAGQDPRDVPAWAAMSGYVEQRFGVWTVPGGLSRVADALLERLSTRGVAVHTSTPVVDLEVADDAVGGVRTEHGTVPADLVVVAVDPRRLPALAPLVRRTLPAMPPVLCHVALRGDLPEALKDLPHEVVLHGDPLLRLTTGGGSGPGPGDRAWTIAGQGRVSEDLVTALARRGLDLRENLVDRVDLSPRDLVERWNGSPAGVAWHGRRTRELRLGTRTPVRGVLCAGAHVTPGAGVPYVGLSAALVAAEVGPAR